MNNTNNDKNKYQIEIIRELELKTERIKNNLEDLNEPLIVEFAGTPRAGKTTAINALSTFFKRNLIPSETIIEQAQFCPLINKNHFFFNTWTGSRTLSHILRIIEENEPKIILIDRGIFDTLVWLNFFRQMGGVSEESFFRSEKFFLIDDWVNKIDIITILEVSPKEAIRRDYQSQITDKAGDIMNESTLGKYNQNLISCIDKYRRSFTQPIIRIDTTNRNPLVGVKIIADRVISTADRLKDSEIAYIPMQAIKENLTETKICTNFDDIKKYSYLIEKSFQWGKRSDIEKDFGCVQIVPVVVFRYLDKILVFEMRGTAQGPILENRQSIWVGGHTRREDVYKLNSKISIIDVFHQTIQREAQEEIEYEINLTKLNKYPKAFVWLDTNQKSLQHLGVFYEFQLKTKKDFTFLNRREFRELKDKALQTEFIDINKIPDEPNLNLEPWSIFYLNAIYKLGLEVKIYQGRMY